MRDSLSIGGQSGLMPSQVTNNPMIKLGKVISVHPEDGSVDVMLLDSAATITVPLLSSWMGSNFGISGMTGPSYHKKQPAKKTYPQEDDADTEYSPTSTKKVGRDTYAVILQLEGNFLGTGDSCCIGFMPAQVSEMLFARHEMNDDGTPIAAEREGEFDDFMVMRHPSDLQMTMDKHSKMSVQLPNGTRLTMGENTAAVDLHKKDYDQRYELRENKAKKASIYGIAVDAGQHRRADLSLSADGSLRGSVYNLAGRKADLTMTDAGLLRCTVYADGGSQEVARIIMTDPGVIEVYAVQEIEIHNEVGCRVVLHDNGNVDVHAPSDLNLTAERNINIAAGMGVEISGGTEIRGIAPMIFWN